MQSHQNEYTALATLRGWVDLCSGRTALLEKCGMLFQGVLSRKGGSTVSSYESNSREKDEFSAFLPSSASSSLELDASLGRIAYLEKKLQFSGALELMNRLLVNAPHATFLLGCKARLLMSA
uniref:Uncharacterized protein n=1 Tax=Lygus hesperus TaxID=30085 RepID=A0A146LID0_LYGHE